MCYLIKEHLKIWKISANRTKESYHVIKNDLGIYDVNNFRPITRKNHVTNLTNILQYDTRIVSRDLKWPCSMWRHDFRPIRRKYSITWLKWVTKSTILSLLSKLLMIKFKKLLPRHFSTAIILSVEREEWPGPF